MPLRDRARPDATSPIIDSLLSEEAVMAFEYGYSTAEPRTLDIWEAQFGDFANGAQVVIDQFIIVGRSEVGPPVAASRCSCRTATKARARSIQLRAPRALPAAVRARQHAGLRADHAGADVPHAAPADAARRAQAADRDDAEVAAAPQARGVDARRSRQRRLPARDSATRPRRIAKKVRRVVLCSGKVYYDLVEDAAKRGIDDVAIVRVEQLYPFPRNEVSAELARYPGREGSGLVPGRADEPGRVVPDQASPAAPASRPSSRCTTPAARARRRRPCGHLDDASSSNRRRSSSRRWSSAPTATTRRPNDDRTIAISHRISRRQPKDSHDHRSQSPGPAGIRLRRHDRDLAQEGRRRGQARREPRRSRNRQGRARSAGAGRRRAEGNQVRRPARP